MTKRRRILVVEDDRDIATTLCDLLHAEGFDVTLAQNGAEAIDQLDAVERPAAVLVDLVMPGIIGQELLEYLRGDVHLAAIPVAIVSGSPHLAPAGYPVFRKPVDLPPLLEFLRDGAGADDPRA